MADVPLDRRFAAVADLYEKHRPTYPREAIDWIVEHAALEPGARVVDLGCGTGISARLFAARGFDVVALDPNDEMLEKARAHGGPVDYRKGSAEATGLPDASVDFAYAAQAFHWFDVAAALREIARILKPSAKAAAIWNVRARTPAMEAYEALLSRASEDYRRVKKPEETMEAIRARVSSIEEASFAHAQSFDWEGLRGRVWSSSYVAHGVRDREAFERELRAIFDRFAAPETGRFAFEYRTIVLLFRPALTASRGGAAPPPT